MKEEEKAKKKGWLATIRESMTKTGGCCGPGESCCGPVKGIGKDADSDKVAKGPVPQKDSAK